MTEEKPLILCKMTINIQSDHNSIQNECKGGENGPKIQAQGFRMSTKRTEK